jgi:hypothetical protein
MERASSKAAAKQRWTHRQALVMPATSASINHATTYLVDSHHTAAAA